MRADFSVPHCQVISHLSAEKLHSSFSETTVITQHAVGPPFLHLLVAVDRDRSLGFLRRSGESSRRVPSGLCPETLCQGTRSVPE